MAKKLAASKSRQKPKATMRTSRVAVVPPIVGVKGSRVKPGGIIRVPIATQVKMDSQTFQVQEVRSNRWSLTLDYTAKIAETSSTHTVRVTGSITRMKDGGHKLVVRQGTKILESLTYKAGEPSTRGMYFSGYNHLRCFAEQQGEKALGHEVFAA